MSRRTARGGRNCEQTVDPRVKGTALRAAGLRPGPDGLPRNAPPPPACFERVRVLSQDPAERGSPSWDCGTKARAFELGRLAGPPGPRVRFRGASGGGVPVERPLKQPSRITPSG